MAHAISVPVSATKFINIFFIPIHVYAIILYWDQAHYEWPSLFLDQTLFITHFDLVSGQHILKDLLFLEKMSSGNVLCCLILIADVNHFYCLYCELQLVPGMAFQLVWKQHDKDGWNTLYTFNGKFYAK